jgi:nucleotide-binding universal stress UspA family protein
MFKKILVPMDGSENAERALPWVKRYAAASHAMAILVRVLQEPHPHEVVDARDYLQRMERELNYAGVPAKTRVLKGGAAFEIARAAAEEKADLVLMTTRGRSRIGRWRVGGTTAQVMRLSPAPVLVVRSRTPLRKQGHVQRVVVPLDGSATAESVLPWAERLAREHKARLILLHVRATKGAAEARRLEVLRSRSGLYTLGLRKRGVSATVRVEDGDPASEILAAAGPRDLVAMTTHGFGGYKRWVFGSVAEKVCAEASVPVFVYKGAAPAARRRSLEGALS